MILKKDIIRLQNLLREQQPSLNSGGCGVFALAFVNVFGGKILRLDDLNDFRFLFTPKPQHLNLLEAMNNCDLVELWSPTHFIIEYRNMYFDGHNFVERLNRDYYDEELDETFKEFRMIVNDDGEFIRATNTMNYEWEHVRKSIYKPIWNRTYLKETNFNSMGEAIDEMYKILKQFKK